MDDRVKYNTYSVPSRLIDEQVRVRVYDERIEVYFRDQQQLVIDRLHGRHHHRGKRLLPVGIPAKLEAAAGGLDAHSQVWMS